MLRSQNLKLSFLALLLPMAAGAQGDLYVPAGTTIYNFGSVGVYGNVVNNGAIGSFANDTLFFYGTSWTNGPNASFPVSGAGGTFSFVQPRPAPYANNVMQTLDGGFTSSTGPSFPHLNINNPNNVSLINTKTRVVDNLNLMAGKVVLNGNDLIMGSASGLGGAGTITSYNQNNYIVTNSLSAHLVKESYTGAYTFPVGIGTGGVTDYAPAKITNNTANGVHVNVSDYAATASVAPRTGNKGINRTWNIYGDNAAANSIIDLQHDTSADQAGFRNSSNFVSRYVGTAPNSAGDQLSLDAWERNTAGPSIIPGTLTTGDPIVTAAERSRTYNNLATAANQNASFYTKASGDLCLAARVYIEGSLISNGGLVASDGRPLMRDNLRSSVFAPLGKNYIPAKDPYEFATTHVNVTSKYTKVAPQGTYPEFQQVTDSATVFGVSGQDAIVDWVFVELRAKNNSASVVATRAALLQRDGDIVEVDGQGCLAFPGVAVDSYYVAVRHRSHLGAMTKYAQSSANLESLVDMSVTSTPLFDFGTSHPLALGVDYTGLAANDSVILGYHALWAGDFNADKKVKFDPPTSDDNVLFADVTVNDPGNTQNATNYNNSIGYWQGDYNMDSKQKYDPANSDHNRIFSRVVLYPRNVQNATNYNALLQQLP